MAYSTQLRSSNVVAAKAGIRVLRTRDELTAARAAMAGPVGFVPTMGALHAGHLALIAAAKAACASTIASIFVNPTQFSDAENAAGYPRDETRDIEALEDAGCDAVWLPDVAALYPPGDATAIDPAGQAIEWEGRCRPGHFRGVATVVAKLFGLVRPDLACFGEKDWQQLQVVRRMVDDLVLPVTIMGVPTVREPDGLAMSSRNRFLNPAERAVAPRLHACLCQVATALRTGAASETALAAGEAELARHGLRVDYLALVDATLQPTSEVDDARLIAAARLGPIRLLDNIPVASTPM
jgi:pantoate--beta-alanine ligase